MDTPGVGAGQRFGGAVDVGVEGARQAAHGAVLDGVGNRLDRGEVTRAGDGEAGFDHIDAQALQSLGDAQLLFTGHGGAGALLAIA
ncbi:hypothetical protein D3C84_633010 [compost metagenome]